MTEQVKLPETIALELPPARVDQVLQALARLPWMEVADTINVIRQQADACIRAFNAPAPEEPAQPAEPVPVQPRPPFKSKR